MHVKKKLRIATRESPMAMCQTEMVRDQLLALYPTLTIDIISMKTEGDKKLDESLAKIGGKGLFVKELEHALLDNRADFAVHSMKDVPYALPEGLCLAAILKRDDPRDVMVSSSNQTLSALPAGARIGTSSLRRQAQLKRMRADIEPCFVRGNVQTRLRKLNEGQFDALILAAAGLKRLGMEDKITEYFSIEAMLPAVGQGAIGLECRSNDEDVLMVLEKLNHQPTYQRVIAERCVSKALQATCSTPIAAYATIDEDKLTLQAFLSTPDGEESIQAHDVDELSHFKAIGERVAKQLVDQGGKAFLDPHHEH